MKLVKMQGLGNDFLLFEDDGKTDYQELAKKLCRRRLSVGGDGIMVVCPSDKADVRMRIINADGSEAEMCGNGIRCFARYVYDNGIVKDKKMSVETLAGIMYPEVIEGEETLVKVDMGFPVFEREKIPMTGTGSALETDIRVDGKTVAVSSLLMGVPHTMVFLEDVDEELVCALGPKIERNEAFPKKTNVNFVKVEDEATLSVTTWERGAGLTLACGTGSCASVVAAALRGFTGRKVTVKLAAGVLKIEYTDQGNVLMTGNAEYVFEGHTL